MQLVQHLLTLEYPGRGLILGMLGERCVGIYFVTVRSAASKAKKYVLSDDQTSITVQTTNARVMARGKLDLLQYTAVRMGKKGFVIGNGRQVDAVGLDQEGTAEQRLAIDLGGWLYEDDTYRTPRITGCVMNSEKGITGALHIIRSNEIGTALRNTFPVVFAPGKGQLITTYRGENVRPTPSFQGSPIDVEFSESSLEALTQSVYGALAPKEGKDDLRVCVMSVAFEPTTQTYETQILHAPTQV